MVTVLRNFGGLIRFAMLCACLFLTPDRVLCKASDCHHDLEEPLASCCLGGECDGSGAGSALSHRDDGTGSLCSCLSAHTCTDVDVNLRSLRAPSGSAPGPLSAPAHFRGVSTLRPAPGLFPPRPPWDPAPDVLTRTGTLRI